MRQEDIVNEIRKKCGHVEKVSSKAWHFIYRGRHFLYMDGNSGSMARFCIPHLIGADECDEEMLSDAINETNRSVRFIKAVKLECGSISLDFVHKTEPEESAETIVPFAVNALNFTSAYFLGKLKRR